MSSRIARAALLAAAFALVSGAPPAVAQKSADSFFAGRTLTMVIAYPPGGGFDLYARIVAMYLGRYIPGHPNIVAENMPGASNFKAANYMYNAAPKDGTFMGALDSTIPFAQRLTGKGKFKPEKFFWVGRLSDDDSVGVVWHTSGIRTIEDAKKKSIFMSAGAVMGPAAMIDSALNKLVGTKFKVVLGYKGSAPMVAAMEKGEVGGAGTFGWTALKTNKAHWLREHLVRVIYVVSYKRNPELPNVPTLVELAKNDTDRKVLAMLTSRSAVGRAYVEPPGIPAERGAVLRQAFDAMVSDPKFLADMRKRKFKIRPATGAKVAKIVADVMDADDKVVARARWATTVEK